MTNDDIYTAIATERLALANMFESLTPQQLRTPSLCEGWSVKHVAAHLTMSFNVTVPGLAIRAIGEGLSVSRAIDGMTREQERRPIGDIVHQIRDHAYDRRHPPGAPAAPLTDVIVHGEDARRPLGITREIPFRWVATSMTFVTGGRAFGFVPSKRIRGLRFVSTDGDGMWGNGDIIHGPALSLLLAVLGRRVAFKDLGGAVHVLGDRL